MDEWRDPPAVPVAGRVTRPIPQSLSTCCLGRGLADGSQSVDLDVRRSLGINAVGPV